MNNLNFLQFGTIKTDCILIINLLLLLLLPVTINAQNLVPEDTCFAQVDGNEFSWSHDWVSKPVIKSEFTQPGTNYGFTIDIFKLDNSFNLEINGTSIATNEIEFQSNNTPGINVEFADGDKYEVDTDEIWKLNGNQNNPIIRVVISPSGNVSLFGSKESGEPLFPLQPITVVNNAFTFNNVVWNSTGTNTVKVMQ